MCCYCADMWTTILASYAAVVSTGSLAVSYLSYRSSGPQLSASAEIEGRYDIDGPKLYIDVHNRGRGPITVDDVMLWGVAKVYEKEGHPIVGWPLRSPSCTLPTRIEGHSGEHWHFPASSFTREWLTRDDLARLEAYIDLATGKILKLKVDTSNIDVLRGDELPGWDPDFFKHLPEGTRLPEDLEVRNRSVEGPLKKRQKNKTESRRKQSRQRKSDR